ncbi:MAG: NAD(P)H-dependent glycerol-3-phosphate dehydrogenase [Traorella sp.]
MKIFVIGSGSWGSALAQICVDNRHEVLIYGNNPDEINEINEFHTNKKYFPDVILNNDLKGTLDLNQIENSDIVVLSVPSAVTASVCRQIQPYLTKPVILVNTSKGFEPNTNSRMSEAIRHAFEPKNLKSVVSLIGPSHAEEVVIRLLTSVCAVSLNEEDAKTVQRVFSNEYFRVYTGNDEIGSELGVAIKNTIALASGMLSGLGYGDNTRAALVTRGLAEMVRFGVAYGGQEKTFMGLTGMGDLIVTCTSVHSRNFEAGYQIGKADNSKVFWENNHKTVEGVRTTEVLYRLKKEKNISMPIVDEIYKVLYENKKPSESAKDLMLRELKAE